MRHLLTFHVCTTLCLQLIFGSFLTGSFLPSILIALEDWDVVFQDCCVRRFRPSVWRWIPLTDRLGRTDLHYRNQEIIVSVLCARFIWLLAFSTTESSPRRQTSTTSALLQETQCARTHSWTLNRCDTDSMRRRNLLVWVHGPSCSPRISGMKPPQFLRTIGGTPSRHYCRCLVKLECCARSVVPVLWEADRGI